MDLELNYAINDAQYKSTVHARKEMVLRYVFSCVSACLLDLASSAWGHCVVVRFCSSAQSFVPKLPPALFSLHHWRISQLTAHTTQVQYTHLAITCHLSSYGNVYPVYAATGSAIFIISGIGKSERMYSRQRYFRKNCDTF